MSPSRASLPSISTVAAFYPELHKAQLDLEWEKKLQRSIQILGTTPRRALQPDPVSSRTRLDLMWFEGELGIRGPSDNADSFAFYPIEDPQSIHPSIVEMMHTLQRSPLPLDMAQLRFRHSWTGLHGLWIDAANLHIKELLEQRTWLAERLEEGWIVECGQKQKAVSIDGDDSSLQLTLEPAPLECWLPSLDHNGDELALLSHVVHFSQPGPEFNRALLSLGYDLLDTLIENPKISSLPQPLNWNEFGCGYGNLSAGFTSYLNSKVPQNKALISEYHPQYQKALMANQKFFPTSTIQTQSAEAHSFQSTPQLWILDPPRPGFSGLLKQLKDNANSPQWILNYHCAEEGLLKDSQILKDSGYQMSDWSISDNFPGTPHVEVISLWIRK